MTGAARALRHRPGAVAALALAVLLFTVAPGPGAARAPAPSRAGPGALGVGWAYGGTAEAAGATTIGRVAVGFTDSSNYAVVLNQSGSSGPVTTLSISRVLGTSGYFAACLPNCSAPVESIRATSSGYEFEAATVELTRNATVTSNGSAVPALGLLAEHLDLVGNLTVRFAWQNLTDPSHPQAEWFNATTFANTTGNFTALTTPAPLGLVPTSVVNGSTWSSTGTFGANATTTYGGEIDYQGTMLPPDRVPFGGTSTPISPMTAGLNGSDAGLPANPALAADAALRLAPPRDGTSLLEGTLLIPTSSYLFAGFASDCELAQRPCLAEGATPELDYQANNSGHVGWDAAVSSIAAFACWFDDSALQDTPDGAPFWVPSSGLAPNGSVPARPAAPSTPRTVTGLPEPLQQAEAVQDAWHPRPTSQPGTSPPPGAPIGPPGHPAHGPGTGAGAGTAIPSLPAPGGLPPLGPWTVAIGTGGAAAVVALLLAARRRRLARRPTEEEAPEPAIQPAEGEEPADPEDEPMGYVW